MAVQATSIPGTARPQAPNVGIGGFLMSVGMDYLAYKAQDKSKLRAALYAVGENLAWQVMSPGFGLLSNIAMGAGTLAPILYRGMRGRWGNIVDRYYQPNSLGGRYVDTQAALTMRQSAVRAMQEARISGRLALGKEATFMHQ